MFEAAELGRTVSKAVYNKKDPELRTALLDAQFKLRELPFPVIIIVSGVEGAGKGEVVNELNRWFDTRGVQTHVTEALYRNPRLCCLSPEPIERLKR